LNKVILIWTSTIQKTGPSLEVHTLLGAENFRKGIDLYFQRHDGQAVTTDDFVQAMQDASRVDLTQFKRWYEQSGTPRLEITDQLETL
jgi:aminopeptidase N